MKKYSVVAIMVLLSVMLIAAGLIAAKSARLEQGEDVTLQIGKSGATWNAAYFSGIATVGIKTTHLQPKLSGVQFLGRLTDVRFVDEEGFRFRTVLGPVYVFYNLTNAEYNQWKLNRLSLYFYDTWFDQWKTCPSYIVETTRGQLRLACRIHAYGLFALGLEK